MRQKYVLREDIQPGAFSGSCAADAGHTRGSEVVRSLPCDVSLVSHPGMDRRQERCVKRKQDGPNPSWFPQATRSR